MRTIVLMALMMTAGTLLAGTTLYRWVDDQGRVHYSDQPRPQAEKIEIAEPSTFDSKVTSGGRQQTTPGRATPPTDTPDETVFAGYRTVAVTAPTQDQVLWNLGGVLNIEVSVQPGLQPDHSIRVSFNGSEIKDWPARATRYQIGDIYRGTHTLSVSVVDAVGKTVASGEAVTFYVKQTSVLN